MENMPDPPTPCKARNAILSNQQNPKLSKG
jgi:hypothetical protein